MEVAVRANDYVPPWVPFFVTVAGFFSFFWSWGTLMTLGIFFDYFRSEFSATDSDVALLQSITTSVIQFFAIVVGLILYKSPSGRPFYFILLGAILNVMGFIGASQAQSLAQLWCVSGLGWGLGSSFLTVATVAVLPSYFGKAHQYQNYRQTATSIMTAGSGIGGLVLPFIFHRLLETKAFRDVLFLSGWINLATLIPWLFVYYQVPVLPLTAKQLNLGVFKEKKVIYLTCGSVIFYFSYFSLNIYLSPYAQDQLGLSLQQVGHALSILGGISTIGRIGAGFLADKTKKPMLLWAIGMSLKAVASVLMVTGNIDVFWFAVVLGGVGHSFGLFLNQVVSDLFGAENLPSIYGFTYCFSGFGSLFGPYALGALVNAFGYFFGMLLMQGTLALGLMFLWRTQQAELPDYQYQNIQEET